LNFGFLSIKNFISGKKMASSILEQIRENMQDVETIEKAIAKQLLYKYENVGP